MDVVAYVVSPAGLLDPDPGGDITPYGNPDNQINVADLLVLQRFVAGDLTPAAEELLIAVVAPLAAPDGVLNAGYIVVLQHTVLGLITLPDVTVGPPAPVLLPVQSPTNVKPPCHVGDDRARHGSPDLCR